MPRNPEGFSPQFFFAPDKRVSGGTRGTTPEKKPEKPINPIDTVAGMSDAHKGIITLARRLLDMTIELLLERLRLHGNRFLISRQLLLESIRRGNGYLLGRRLSLGVKKYLYGRR